MNRILLPLLIMFFMALAACGRGQSVNGHTLNTAYRSVKMMKERVPPDSRMEFEVSFWTIRDAHKDNEEFLDAVDGKTAMQIIEMAKEIYQERKSTGFKGYELYNSWEEMIANYDKVRMNQDKDKVSTKRNFDTPNTTILYNLRAPQR